MDRPRGPHGPDHPDEPDDGSDDPNQPDSPNGADQPGEREQPETDQPRRWHEFAFDDAEETDAEREAFYAFQQKEQLRAEGYDPALLDELFGTGAT